MKDYFQELYGGERAFADANNYDANGDFKPQKVAVRDSTAEASTRRRGFVRGFQALETMLPTRDSQDAAVQAYDAKRARLDTARRTNDGTTDVAKAYDERSKRLERAWCKDQRDGERTPPSTQDARAIADAAYADKRKRLEGAWRR
jgi:hypothetical protein